jgi:hypothetical protein
MCQKLGPGRRNVKRDPPKIFRQTEQKLASIPASGKMFT